LVVGFVNGVFALYDLPEFNNIHTLSISQARISSIAINNTGEWIAIASALHGQLLVWEWRSESCMLLC
jgi:periodic tryptophan protein 2